MSNLADSFEKWWKQIKKDKACKQSEDKVAAIFISGWRACEMAMRDGGKGDTPRPLGVPMEQFDRNFESIFGKKTKLPQPEIKEEKQNEVDSNSSNSNR